MREFLRRLSKKVDESRAQAEEEKLRAAQEYQEAQARLAKSIEETNEKVRRYEEDRDAIIADDDRRLKEGLAAEKAEREARKAQRQKLLDEAKSRSE